MSNIYKNRKRLSITLSPDTIKELDKLSMQQHTNRSQCITNLVWSAINENTTKEVNDYGYIKE